MKKAGWVLTAALLLSGCQQMDGAEKDKQTETQEKTRLKSRRISRRKRKLLPV